MAPDQANLLHGTLDRIILRALARSEMHRLGISRRIEQITKGTFQVPGSLFPVCLAWKNKAGSFPFAENPKTIVVPRSYKLTFAGLRRWGRIVLAIRRTLDACGGEILWASDTW